MSEQEVISKIHFLSDDITLYGNIAVPLKHRNVGVLIMHGGGQINADVYKNRQQALAENGFASLAFNFRGVGQSEGVMSESTLTDRLHDAIAAYDILAKHVDTIVVMGASMGGFVAIKLTGHRNVAGLILIGSAAYAREAELLPFNHEFTAILHTWGSWTNSQSYELLQKYTKPVLLVYGSEDKIIPSDIQEKYRSLLKPGDIYVEIPGAPHTIPVEMKELLLSPVMEFLKKFV